MNTTITPTPSSQRSPTILLVGASRGLGCAMAGEFLKTGWNVVGTVRDDDRTPLHELAAQHAGRLDIQTVDITRQHEIDALCGRLAARRFDMLFVNAGTANANQDETIAQVSTDEFVRVMLTNALAPMRVVERLQHLVAPQGLIGAMSSGQGSVGNNEKGGHEVYRGTKAALNMYMRSYAARQAGAGRSLVLMAPGWIRTGLGGPDAPFGLEETVPDIVRTLCAQQGKTGLQYIDRHGQAVPW